MVSVILATPTEIRRDAEAIGMGIGSVSAESEMGIGSVAAESEVGIGSLSAEFESSARLEQASVRVG